MEINSEINDIIGMLQSPMTVESIKRLSDYSSINEKDAINYINKYHEVLDFQVRFSKYGMDNIYINDAKAAIINSIILNRYKEKKLVI